MPGSPFECREHALHCGQLALKAPSAEAKLAFLETARGWETLAAEIEGDEAFLKTMDEIELKAESKAA